MSNRLSQRFVQGKSHLANAIIVSSLPAFQHSRRLA
jgi:hypothetical protein